MDDVHAIIGPMQAKIQCYRLRKFTQHNVYLFPLSSLATKLEQGWQMEHRKSERVNVDQDILCYFNSQKVAARICDLSVNGCHIEISGIGPAQGSPICLKLGDFASPSGYVAWKKGPHAGVQFDHQIHNAIVKHYGYNPARSIPITPFVDRIWRGSHAA